MQKYAQTSEPFTCIHKIHHLHHQTYRTCGVQHLIGCARWTTWTPWPPDTPVYRSPTAVFSIPQLVLNDLSNGWHTPPESATCIIKERRGKRNAWHLRQVVLNFRYFGNLNHRWSCLATPTTRLRWVRLQSWARGRSDIICTVWHNILGDYLGPFVVNGCAENVWRQPRTDAHDGSGTVLRSDRHQPWRTRDSRWSNWWALTLFFWIHGITLNEKRTLRSLHVQSVYKKA